MSNNSDYAALLVGKLEKVPSVAVTAVGKAVYAAVLDSTLQDSGEAAFNWRAQINTSRSYPYVFSRGRAPVGSTGDKRSLGFDRNLVVDYRYKDFLDRLFGKTVKSIHIYNPIEDMEHAMNARLASAEALATGADWMDDIAERATNAYLRSSQ